MREIGLLKVVYFFLSLNQHRFVIHWKESKAKYCDSFEDQKMNEHDGRSVNAVAPGTELH